MRTFSTVVVILCVMGVIGAVGYWAWQQFISPQATFLCASLDKSPVIVAFGDSLVAGYGAPEQQGFVEPLSQKLGIAISNEGESGDTTAQGLARLQDVLNQNPNIVIVLLGGNDALQQIPLATTESNLQQILSTLAQNHIQVVLVGVLGGFPIDPFAPMFAQLAKEYPVTYVPNILNGLIGNTQYMYDEVHPNASGYDIIATRLYTAVNAACYTYSKSVSSDSSN
jgi:acyl-CoA thioesterase-1